MSTQAGSGRERFPRHEEVSGPVHGRSDEVFAFIDDHARLSSHMSERSALMGGGRMTLSVDEGHGQRVGSHIKMGGRVFGLRLELDEVVTVHEPPRLKTWETVGQPRLLVVGHYRMQAEVADAPGGESTLRVSIDYALPDRNRWLGQLFGAAYARWCVRSMFRSAQEAFAGREAIASA